MNSKLHLLSTILISLYVQSVEPTVFCDPNIQKKSLVDLVFNMGDTIYLIRKDDYWISHYLTNLGKPDPTPSSVTDIFKGVVFKKLMAGFLVESIPKASECDQSSDEKCWFNEYMLNTAFIFYKSDDTSNQIYSMVRWDDKNGKYVFDDQIGGYGFMLRANRSLNRSTWPGIDRQNDEMIASLFHREKTQIVLFIKKDKGNFVVKKSLDEEWDRPAVAQPFVSQELVGAFRRENKYYFIEKSGRVSEFNSDFTAGTPGSEDKKFFSCS